MFEVSCKHHSQDIPVEYSKHSPLCDAGIQRRGINLKAVAPGANAAGRDRASLAVMRSKIMPTQEKFDPIVYLGTVHWVRASHAAIHLCERQGRKFLICSSRGQSALSAACAGPQCPSHCCRTSPCPACVSRYHRLQISQVAEVITFCTCRKQRWRTCNRGVTTCRGSSESARGS